MSRETNQQLADRFRNLLTNGALNCFERVAENLPEDEIITADYFLRATKEWRGQLWATFSEVEDRLNPLREIDRQKQRKNK